MNVRLLLLYGLALLVFSSRGVFELVSTKLLGYSLQLFFLTAISVALFIKTKPKTFLSSRSYSMGAIVLALMTLGLLCSIGAGEVTPSQAFLVFAVNALNLTFVIHALRICSLHDSVKVAPGFEKCFHGIVVVSALYACTLTFAQFLGYVEFPGDASFQGASRLSGPYGSKQHLSLSLALHALLLLSIWLRSKGVIAFFALLVTLFLLLMSYTRIGYVVFLLPLAHYFIVEGRKAQRLTSLITDPRAILFGLVLAVSATFVITRHSEGVELLIARFQTIDVGEESNSVRIAQWMAGVEFYASHPSSFLISTMTGSASQIPRQLLGIDTPHYESGQIQYLINFGALAFLLINYMFLTWYVKSPRQSVLKFVPITAAAALFIYMFNEIVPVFVLFPIIAIEQLLLRNGRHLGSQMIRSEL
jgi:O-Antigen ligase.